MRIIMNQGKHGMFHHVDKDFVRTVEFERNDVEQPLLSSNSSFNHKYVICISDE